jgi:hypothetical protein
MDNLVKEQKKPECRKPTTSNDKWRFTIYTTILLLILFNPLIYKLVNKLLSNFVGAIASKDGCPTLLGFGIHAAIFTIIVRLLMDMNI